jgi:hypothetical protein
MGKPTENHCLDNFEWRGRQFIWSEKVSSFEEKTSLDRFGFLIPGLFVGPFGPDLWCAGFSFSDNGYGRTPQEALDELTLALQARLKNYQDLVITPSHPGTLKQAKRAKGQKLI